MCLVVFDLVCGLVLFPFRQMKLNNELNNMSWRVRPDDVLLEVGRLYGSKVGLQKLNAEVRNKMLLICLAHDVEPKTCDQYF